MRKPGFCLWENKGADQLCSNCKADQHLCFHYTDSTIPLFSKSKISSLQAIFCALYNTVCVRLVANPEGRFSHVTAHIFKICLLFFPVIKTLYLISTSAAQRKNCLKILDLKREIISRMAHGDKVPTSIKTTGSTNNNGRNNLLVYSKSVQ